MKKYLLPFSLGLLLTLTACGPKPPQPTPTPVPTPVPTPGPTQTLPPVPTGLVWEDQTLEHTFTADDGVPVLNIHYTFPSIQGADANPAWAAIRDYYAEEGQHLYTAATENADAALADYDVTASLGYDFAPYYEEAGYSVYYQTEELVSIRRSFYSESGGAYPLTYQFSEQFDLASGKKLEYADFFSDDPDARQAVVQSILDQAELRTDADALDQATLASEFQAHYFYLTADSFVFYYQPDTVAPHAAGIIEFSVPRADLQEWLLR